MIKVLALVAALMGCATTPAHAGTKPQVVEITEDNSVVLRGVMTEESTSKVLSELILKDRDLPADEPLYLYIDSPGGSIVAGVEMIEGIEGLGREVTTISTFSASMAFITVESLGKRLILPSGVLMSHRAKGGVEGQIPGEMDTRYWFWKKYLNDVLKPVAKRLGLTVKELTKQHRDEWWMFGKDAVEQDAADAVTLVKCDASLTGTYHQEVQTMFGPLDVTWDKCPLVGSPLKVDMKKVDLHKMSAADRAEFEEAVHELLYDRRSFLSDFVMNGRYKKWFK